MSKARLATLAVVGLAVLGATSMAQPDSASAWPWDNHEPTECTNIDGEAVMVDYFETPGQFMDYDMMMDYFDTFNGFLDGEKALAKKMLKPIGCTPKDHDYHSAQYRVIEALTDYGDNDAPVVIDHTCVINVNQGWPEISAELGPYAVAYIDGNPAVAALSYNDWPGINAAGTALAFDELGCTRNTSLDFAAADVIHRVLFDRQYVPPEYAEVPEGVDTGGAGHGRCRVSFGTGGFHWSCSVST